MNPGFYGLSRRQQHQLRAGVHHLAVLGVRPLCELLIQVGQERRDLEGILNLLNEWRDRLSPAMIQGVGAEGLSPRTLQELPPEMVRGAA